LKIKAFSSIELAISTAIIFLFIIFTYYSYSVYIEYSKVATFIENSRFIRMASDRYFIDKGFYPPSIIYLFTDPYRDYLPKQIASSFLYSPWNTQVNLYSSNVQNQSMVFLYLEYKEKNKEFISHSIREKIKENLYFCGYSRFKDKEFMVFLLSKIHR